MLPPRIKILMMANDLKEVKKITKDMSLDELNYKVDGHYNIIEYRLRFGVSEEHNNRQITKHLIESGVEVLDLTGHSEDFIDYCMRQNKFLYFKDTLDVLDNDTVKAAFQFKLHYWLNVLEEYYGRYDFLKYLIQSDYFEWDEEVSRIFLKDSRPTIVETILNEKKIETSFLYSFLERLVKKGEHDIYIYSMPRDLDINLQDIFIMQLEKSNSMLYKKYLSKILT